MGMLGFGFLPLLDGTVGLDIDNVADSELLEVGRQVDHTLLPEVSGEGILHKIIPSALDPTLRIPIDGRFVGERN